jgi:hypothetical protein
MNALLSIRCLMVVVLADHAIVVGAYDFHVMWTVEGGPRRYTQGFGFQQSNEEEVVSLVR